MNQINKNILGVKISTLNNDEVLEEVRKYLKKDQRSKIKDQRQEIKPFIIYTPNPEIVMYAQKDEEFKEIVNAAQINIPDGIGIVWALQKLHQVDAARVTGVDLVWQLCKMAASGGYRIGIIGGRGGVALRSLECLRNSYPNLKATVLDEPEIEISNLKSQISKFKINYKKEKEYFGLLVQEIIRKNIEILFVGLGAPKQEYFIENLKFEIRNLKLERLLVLMAVGGSLDIISGRIKRAPELIRRWGLEWLYRLLREPRRWRRQLALIKFIYLVLTA